MHTNEKKLNRYQKHQQQYGDKKHVTQMNELEKDFLLRKFHSVSRNDWKFTDYSEQRFNERGIDPAHFLTLFRGDAELIEYHFKKNNNRVLLRSKAIHNEAQVCAVFSIEQKRIVTVYLNYHGNKHEQLKLEFYDADLDILETYKGGK